MDPMEYEQDSNKNDEEGGFVQRVKESPRTVSALIIILIVAAAIYAFSGDNQQPAVTMNGEGTTTEETPGAEPTPEGQEPTGEISPAPTAAAPAPVAPETISEQARTLPEARRTDAGYVEVAQSGDGVTHLARRATTRFLSENTVDFAMTNEHRIFIEDYIKDNVGSQRLALGEEATISFDLIREAVAAAGQLNDQQLQNLSQYSYVLST